jgi:hypothetical protein
MRFRVPHGCALAGSLLLLVIAVGPLFAVAPPAALLDSRQSFLFHQGAYRRVRIGWWIEQGPSGQRMYREHRRTGKYVELHDPARNRLVRLYDSGHYVYVRARDHYAWAGPGRWAHHANQPLDYSRNSSEREKLTDAERRTGFPRLGEHFEVLAPATFTYNCIGWSLGISGSWVWPTERGVVAYLHHFDALYGYYGFQRVQGLDYKRQPSHDKVLLYAVRNADGRIQPTHAALQMADGSWTSKVGTLPLIRHLHPHDLAGPSYGVPYVMYVRARPLPR